MATELIALSFIYDDQHANRTFGGALPVSRGRYNAAYMSGIKISVLIRLSRQQTRLEKRHPGLHGFSVSPAQFNGHVGRSYDLGLI
jgi:hypothetical protein